MAGDLILGGLFQGWSWAALQPWEASVQVSIPFWSVRIVAGLVMFAAQLLFIANFYLTWRNSQAEQTQRETRTGTILA